jgi:hypothetical protein
MTESIGKGNEILHGWNSSTKVQQSLNMVVINSRTESIVKGKEIVHGWNSST